MHVGERVNVARLGVFARAANVLRQLAVAPKPAEQLGEAKVFPLKLNVPYLANALVVKGHVELQWGPHAVEGDLSAYLKLRRRESPAALDVRAVKGLIKD